MYRVVHLHSTHAVALSCLEAIYSEQPVPPLTPYYFMRVAPLAVLPYFRPGSPGLAGAVGDAATRHNCLLLRNHGLICLGSELSEAVDRAEELEETAHLYFLLRGERVRYLSPATSRNSSKHGPEAEVHCGLRQTGRLARVSRSGHPSWTITRRTRRYRSG